jgi:hypothetical protein
MLSSSNNQFEDCIYSNESSSYNNYYEGTVYHEKITTNLNEHIDKLLADLEFIEQPLVGKRIRKTKKQIQERL